MHVLLRYLLTLALILSVPLRAPAQALKENNFVKTLNLDVTRLASDPARHRIYASLRYQNEVVVIDANTLTITKRIPMGPEPVGLTLSVDGSKLFVAINGEAKIGVIDLATLAALPSLGPTVRGWDIQAGLGNRLYLSSSGGGIAQVDASTGARLSAIQEDTYIKASLQLSPDRKTLYAADTSTSGGVLEKIDVSTSNAVLSQKVSADGGVLKLSHDGTTLCYGNHLFNAADLTAKATFPPYEATATFTADDAGVFTANPATGVSLFDASTFAQRAVLPLSQGNPSDVITAGSGRYLFVAGFYQTQIYDLYRDVAPKLFPVLGQEISYHAPIFIIPNSITATTMPPGLTFDPATQMISGTPSQEGAFPITITASDATRTVTAHLTVTVYPIEFAANISTRAYVGPGDDALIAGFIISGGDEEVVVRSVGPSLQLDGKPLAGRLEDTTLELYDSTGALLASNDDWQTDPQAYVVDNFGLAPPDASEAALYRNLPPGAYTLVMRGAGDTSGLGLAEIYGLDSGYAGVNVPRLANLSTRGKVGTGDNVMIAGVILTGSDPAKMLVRALGPSLAAADVPAPLANPQLDVYESNGARIASNNDWRDTQEAEIQNTGLPPTDERESAISQSLLPGAYTAIVRGTGGTSGVAIVEAYNLP